MSIQKVNNFTIVKNALTSSGRKINKQIRQLQSKHPESAIYQRNFGNNKTALLTDIYEDNAKTSSLLLMKDGNIVGSKETTNFSLIKNFDLKYKYYSTEKKIFDSYNYIKQQINKAVLFRMSDNKIEESATKIKFLDGPVKLKIYSAADRKSDFPALGLSGKLHPSLARKTVMKNGDVIYAESHDRG